MLELRNDWRFREVSKNDWRAASVPGEIHTDLMRAGLIDDPFYRDNEHKLQWIGKTDWEYECRFSVAAEIMQRENIDLVFDGLDTYASVFLNDTLIIEADNMFRPWRADCKTLLKHEGNSLRICFRSPINEILPRKAGKEYELPAVNDAGEKTSPYTRKAPYHFGWDWGPRFVTCGIWQPVYLEAWDHARIVDLQIVQNHLSEQSAKLTATVEVRATNSGKADIEIASEDHSFKTISRAVDLMPGVNSFQIDFIIESPKLWWPNGMGEQPLHNIVASLSVNKKSLGQTSRRIALRTVELRQIADAWGKSFEFIVNGAPVFAKGGNWIPADNFLSRVDKNRYAHLLNSAKAANMNMLRVWGGGIYENDEFYDLCDELGIMVWQDFMFACSMYPAEEKDLAGIEAEAAHQVKRLRHHPCIVLWCGNNEIEIAWKGWGWKERLPESVWDDYEKIFHKLLPNVCQKLDPSRPYWPSSPSSNGEGLPNSQTSGDMHYWGVWHSAEPFAAYLNQTPRFMSEYGFQSFPSLKTVNQFTLPEDHDLASPVMVTHQKHGRGNELIRIYTLHEYDEPKDFASFLYVSQIVQAEGIKLGTEHYRRIRPRCMGALYWQINDCWPVASWSSIDYYGRWKALHYFAKKFFAPILVSFHGKGDNVNIYVVSDYREPTPVDLRVMLMDFTGNIKKESNKKILVRELASEIYLTLDKNEWLVGIDERNVFLFAEASRNGSALSTNTLFFRPAKELILPRPNITTTVMKSKSGFQITLRSDKLAKHVFLSSSGHEGFFTDNYFHLLPEKEVEIEFQTEERIDLEAFKKDLKVMSLVDAFSSGG